MVQSANLFVACPLKNNNNMFIGSMLNTYSVIDIQYSTLRWTVFQHLKDMTVFSNRTDYKVFWAMPKSQILCKCCFLLIKTILKS